MRLNQSHLIGLEEGYDELEPRITERLVVEPAKVYVLRTIRRVWKSKETNNIAPLPPPPPHVFDRCSVDESVIVHIILNRFLYHLPYYRQEKMFRLMACPLSRDNMIRWCNDLAFLFAPIVDAIEREVKASRAIYIDETPFLGRITGRKNGKYTQIYFWPLLAKDIGFVFRWSESRNNEIAKKILEGLGPTTAVVCDGLNIYQHCVKELKFNMQLCWAHIRRKFYEALPSNQILADRAMEMIGQIFAQEGKLLKQKLLPEMLLEKRNALVKPELDSFIDWVRSISTDPEVITSSKLNTACQYLLTRENEARYFLTNPFVLMHNNDNERESKNFKLGVKNWLFVSSPEGANALSIFYSLLRTAQIHGIHPFYYLLDLCKRIEQPGLKAADLTPREWKKRFFEEAVPENYRQESS